MNDNEFLRQVAYGVSIIVLFNHVLYLCADGFGFSDVVRVLFFGVFGIVALLLGLFVFHRSLSVGLTLGGVLATRLAWFYFTFTLTELLQFVIAVAALSAVCFALYRLYRSEPSSKNKRLKK